MKKIGVFTFALLFLVATEAFAQNAVAIDVTSLSIQKGYSTAPLITLTATGLPAPFQSPLSGRGGGIMNTLESCRPCFLGASLATGFGWDGGANFFSGFQIGGFTGDSKQVKLYLYGASPSLALTPTLRIRNRVVFLTAPAEIQGKLEIYDGNTLVAFDDEVNLKGSLKAEFGQYRAYSSNGDRRGFDFRNITFTYSQ